MVLYHFLMIYHDYLCRGESHLRKCKGRSKWSLLNCAAIYYYYYYSYFIIGILRSEGFRVVFTLDSIMLCG